MSTLDKIEAAIAVGIVVVLGVGGILMLVQLATK